MAEEVVFVDEVERVRPKLPASLMVFGILSIFYGASGMICTPLTFWAQFIKPVAREMEKQFPQWYIDIQPIVMGVSVMVSFALLVLGIGLLRRCEWGRFGLILTSFAGMVIGVCFSVITILGILEAFSMNGGPDNPEAIGKLVGGIVGGVIGSLTGLVFYGLQIWFLSRQTAVDVERKKVCTVGAGGLLTLAMVDMSSVSKPLIFSVI